MKTASLDVIIWLIVFAVMAIAKGWGKLQKQIDEDSSESKEMPPAVPAPRSATARASGPPKPQRPQPMRTVAPVARTPQPRPQAVSRTAPAPVGSPAPREAWRIDPEKMRRFVEQVSGQARQPVPPPVAQPRVHKVEPTALPTPKPATAAHIAKHPMAETPPPPKAARALQWAEALRDRQNIRNIIISAEIIGPPKSL